MGKPTISTEWTICDSEAEWASAKATEEHEHRARTTRAGMRRVWLAAAATVLLGLALTGAWLWRTAHAGLNEIEAELSAAVDQELWAIRQDKPDLAVDLATGSRHKELQARLKQDYALLRASAAGITSADEILTDVEIVRLHEEQAVVRVVVEIGGDQYRQTRVYRRTPEGWLQIPPDWVTVGEWRRLDTEHLSFGYFAWDEAAVAEAAVRLENFVVQTRTDFGLSSTTKQVKYGIEITPDRYASEQYALSGMHQSYRMVYMTSPSVLFLPIAVSDAGAIVQLIGPQLSYALVHDALDQAGRPLGTTRGWLPLLSALRLWEFWASDAPLAEWKDEIIEMGVNATLYSDDAPAQYDDTCRAYRAWNLSPLSMSIPLTCKSAGRDLLLTAAMPDTLHGLHSAKMTCCVPEEFVNVNVELHVVGLTTVLDYAVATYGRAQLPVLVHALNEHERWETLIPAVFGVSAEEFEAGWQDYVTTRYPQG